MIGSFKESNKLESVNDIDLVIVINKLTASIYCEILDKFQVIARRLQSTGVVTIIETKRGPIKPNKSNKKKIVQLHLLIWDIEDVKKNMRSSIILDIVNFGKRLRGRNFSAIKKIKKITKEDILRDLEIHIEGINSGKTYVGETIIKNNKLSIVKKFFKLTKSQRDELNTHHIIMAFTNYLRYFNPKIKKDKRILLENSEKILPKEYSNILTKAYLLKEKIRKETILSAEESLQLRNESIKFINYLSGSINKNE